MGKTLGEKTSVKKKACRFIIYVAGLMILAMGIILNTKAGLGVSPIISVSYSISQITKTNFGNMTFILYGVFVVIEIILHCIIWKRRTTNGGFYNLKKIILMDVLQFPLSFFFTRVMNLFSSFIPNLTEDMPGTVWSLRFVNCNNFNRSRSCNVTGYENYPKSGRWNCSGNC